MTVDQGVRSSLLLGIVRHSPFIQDLYGVPMTDRTSTWTTRMRWLVVVGYVLCWVIGLVVGGPPLTPDADSAEVTDEFRDSPTHLIFAIFVHGIAAVLLVALGRSLASTSTSGGVITFAAVAAILSLVQLAGEIFLTIGPEIRLASVVWQFICRADGVKMLVLAGLIVLVHGGHFRGRLTLTIVSAAASISLLLSGIGYLNLNAFLMEVTTASLPLLLIWALMATAERVSEMPSAKVAGIGR